MTVDLTTKYLGIPLAHPLVPSASPLSGNPDALHRLVEAGAAAVVLPSLFEEQVEHEAMAVHEALEFGAANSPEATEGYFPEMDRYNTGPERYLDLVRTAKAELDVPIIASVNGSTPGMDPLRQDPRRRGDRRPRAQRLPGCGRRRSHRVPGRTRVPAAGRAGAQAVPVPLAVKVGPFFFDGEHGSPARRRRSGWARPLQPVLPARTSISTGSR